MGNFFNNGPQFLKLIVRVKHRPTLVPPYLPVILVISK
jgi:hypothetical protein